MAIAIKNVAETVNQNNSMTEIIPFLVPLDDETVLCKDGAMLALYTYAPADTDGLSPGQVDDDAAIMERALMTLRREDVMAWMLVNRSEKTVYPTGQHDNPVAKKIEALYRKDYLSQRHYSHRFYIAILMTHATRGGRVIETFMHHMNQGKSIGLSASSALKEAFGFGAMEIAEEARLKEQQRELDSVLNQFTATASPLRGLHRLSGGDLWGALDALVSPAESAPRPIQLPQTVLLDGYLGRNTITVKDQELVFEGVSTEKHIAVLSVKNEPDAWPENTKPGMLDILYGVDAEWTLSIALRMVNMEQARGFVKAFRRFYLNTRKGLRSVVGETISGQQSDNVNVDAEVKADEANDALRSFAGSSPVAAYTNLTLVVKADTTDALERDTKRCNEALSEHFQLIRERSHLFSAWAGTIPGQWALPVRWVFLTGGAIADLLPIRGIYEGNPVNPYYEKQYRRNMPAITAMNTAQKTPFYFNFHAGDLGHTLIVGPSRSGKSAMVNFLISQWMKYQNARIFVFDKDHSNWITTLMLNGDYLGLAEPGGLSMNPVKTLKTEQDWAWFTQWADYILSVRDGPLTTDEGTELANAVQRLKAIPEDLRDLPILGDHFFGPLAAKLRGRLAPWIGNGMWSAFFSGQKDGIRFSRYTTISMDDILAYPEPARAFLNYLFYRIEHSLDGEPTMIYIEEAWFAFEDPIFSQRLKEWLKRLAKLNVIVVMATQSVFEVEGTKAFASIIDNVPTLLMLPHRRATAFTQLYRDNFQFSPEQVQKLTELTQKSDYYVVQNGDPKVLKCRFRPDVLAYLRSDSAARELFKHWRSSGRSDWREQYAQEAQQLD
ncbi:VirB4 family type IV secretion system protein [Acidithiobacillus ferridurans]|uniref:Type IV secretion system protein virB4 n=1 Tax=Acidithiobacillus ferridurans TaxID=1232575 RepID=A0A8X8KAG2_ACIFI|nr:hypothetical protein [Acidithiobacillus ferridurans]MBU2714942.1 hypothetical protein [Acidithiobacillus ferridurans]MBU2722797.1 hypothetical protein [Acidithiobacillus ferridurans]MBU2727816.1 hypothetical protein [Acidithiobacillus ferridurans]